MIVMFICPKTDKTRDFTIISAINGIELNRLLAV